jgi:plasmid maintenance system antidote protein VapI
MTGESFIYPFNVTKSSMVELLEQLNEEKRIEEICRNKSLNINLLSNLFKVKMRGYNNTLIAQKLGVHRVTIQRYMDALRNLTESEFELLFKHLTKGAKEADEQKN